MARLIYLTNVSLDGFIEDAQGRFDWSEPDDELFAYITDLIRPVGTFLYGRALYDTMAVWETQPELAEQSALHADFARAWSAADKVVFSTTLDNVATTRTRLERRFDPELVRDLTTTASRDLVVGGAQLAASAFAAGLVDECQLLVRPVILGGGKPALPTGLYADLDLLDCVPVGRGTVHLRYAVRA
jgi:dihydrofolate reductase